MTERTRVHIEEPNKQETPKIVPLDYATRRAQVEQEFIERFHHCWTVDGGTVRPVGLKKMTLRGLERCIENANKERYIDKENKFVMVVNWNAKS